MNSINLETSNPETPQEIFEEDMRKAAYIADFCPSSQWFRKVSNYLFERYDIVKKSELTS